MSRCNNCKIEILDLTEKCPLCQSVIEGEIRGKHAYPNITARFKVAELIFRFIIFLSIVTSGICIVVNLLVESRYYWSFIVVSALALLNWTIYILAKDNAGYRFRTLSVVAGVVALVIIIDIVSGYRAWSINYVMPGAIIFIDIALVIVMIINRRNWQSYLTIQLAMVFLCIIPLLFIKFGLIRSYIVSDVALVFTVVLFLGTLIIGGRRSMTEMKRRFYI